jgi:hypothetical protein
MRPVDAGGGSPWDWPLFIGFGRPPFASLLAPEGGWQAAPQGVALGTFGWADPATGLVSNAQVSGAVLGFVLPVQWLWNRHSISWRHDGLPVLAGGRPVVVGSVGDFFTPFPDGAQQGAQVYVDPATGLPYSQDNGGYVASPWVAMNDSDAGHLARVTTSVKAFN